MTIDLSHLTRPPFSLGREAVEWVRTTFEGLDDAGRAGQVFNMLSRGEEPQEREMFRRFMPGGITRYFSPDGGAERNRLALLQGDAAVPLLVSADLEGSRMSLPFGTQVPNPIALAAIDDLAVTEDVSGIMAAEALAVGVNWSFTPMLDITRPRAARSSPPAASARTPRGSPGTRSPRSACSSGPGSPRLPSTGRARGTTIATSTW
jgi:beta-N-acetylhexosaminidase